MKVKLEQMYKRGRLQDSIQSPDSLLEVCIILSKTDVKKMGQSTKRHFNDAFHRPMLGLVYPGWN